MINTNKERLPYIVFYALWIVLFYIPMAMGATDFTTVNGRQGVCDTLTGRVLVAVADESEAADMPATIEENGRIWAVTTTTLPIVSLDHGNVVSDTFQPGSMRLIHGDGTAEEYHTLLRYRGASSLIYDKKNYAVKLTDANGEDMDASLLGMRSDNSWILDAMAADMARMRNRVSTDLWLALSTRPYYANLEPSMVNGTHGEFVEVTVNGAYWGIYCLTEKVDRKQLKAKKYQGSTVRGVLYKAIAHDSLREITEVPKDSSATWQGWEFQYPDPSKGEPSTWQPLYSLAELLSQPEGSKEVEQTLETRVDLPVWIDYCLLMDLMHATDNGKKNMFVYFRDITASDVRACICPWDMDATWGRTWRRIKEGPETNCNISNGVNFHMYTTLPDGFYRQCQRWAELRDAGMTAEYILAIFDRYFDLFERSGAAGRETERWNGINDVTIDFETEKDYIHDWVPRRIVYLDTDYGYHKTQGFQDINSENHESEATYGIDGRKTSNSTRGIVIKNGRKILR